MLIVIIDTDPDGEAGRAAVDQALARVQPEHAEQRLEQAYVDGYMHAMDPAAHGAPGQYVSVPMQAQPLPGHMLPYTPDPTDNFISPAVDPFAEHHAAVLAHQQVAHQQAPSPDELAAWIEQQQRDAIARVARATPTGMSPALEPVTPDIDLPGPPPTPQVAVTPTGVQLPPVTTPATHTSIG